MGREEQEGGAEGSDGRRGGIDRRSLIKGAAIAGAAAWTAPVIIDSLASPAAALSAGCWKIRVSGLPGINSCGTALPTSSSAWGTTCDSGFANPVGSSPCNSAITSITVNVATLASLGITRSSCGVTSSTLLLSLPSCNWVAGRANSLISGCNNSSSINNGTAGSRTISFAVGSFVTDYYLVVTCA